MAVVALVVVGAVACCGRDCGCGCFVAVAVVVAVVLLCNARVHVRTSRVEAHGWYIPRSVEQSQCLPWGEL